MEEQLLKRIDRVLRELDHAEVDRQPERTLDELHDRLRKLRAALKRVEDLPV